MAALLPRLGAATSSALRDASQAADVELIGAHDFGDDRAKRQILETVVSNLTLTGKILNIEARKPFSTQVDSGTCHVGWLGGRKYERTDGQIYFLLPRFPYTGCRRSMVARPPGTCFWSRLS
jgi:hypothetical protein